MYEKRSRQTHQGQMHMITIEDLVPQDHILRKIDAAIDFSFIYDEVSGMYNDELGRPGIDPVALFKIVMIQYLFGIRSMRQTIKEIESNYAYRWFIGYDIGEDIPHFSTFGKNYVRRFKGTDIFENIFTHILDEAIKCGFVDASAVFIDGTHIKASANKRKSVKEEIFETAKCYRKELDKEIDKDRIAHGKKPMRPKKYRQNTSKKKLARRKKEAKNKKNTQEEKPETEGSIKEETAKTKTITKSTTDPDCGMFHKGEHERQFAYVANTACDKHNFVLDFVIGAGNIHDSVMFDDIYDKVTERFEDIETIAVDAGYRTPWIAKKIIDDGRIPSMPYKRPVTKKNFFKKYDYVYDEYYDCVICPNNKILKYSTTNREGYREYKSNPQDCKNCPYRYKCTESKEYQKVFTQHVWEGYMELVEDYRYTPKYKEIYEKRKETIERVFADAKEKHGMRYTQYRGLAKVEAEAALRFACMNLKKLANWKWKKKGNVSHFIEIKLTHIKRGFAIVLKPLLSTV